MLAICFFSILFYLNIESSFAQKAPEIIPNILRKLPHDSGCFTQGFFWKDGLFWESCGEYGKSNVRRSSPESGLVLLKKDLPGDIFAEGLSFAGNRLFLLTWKENLIFELDPRDLTKKKRFVWPYQGWGITFDGRNLVISDGTDKLRFVDPDNMSILRTISVYEDKNSPIDKLNELEWIKGRIWANIWQSDRIAVIDPENGRVIEWINIKELSGLAGKGKAGEVANGIAYDPNQDVLYITGKHWSRIFKIRAPRKENK